jgi:phosphoesterase RecJ-like protein
MAGDDLAVAASFLRSRKKFLVLSHVRPDGDAFGAALALGLSLRLGGADVRIANEDGISPAFRFLPGADSLEVTPQDPMEGDRAIVAVDCGDLGRLGPRFAAWGRTPDLNVDHHVSNTRFARTNWVDETAPATCQMLAELLRRESFPCDASVASNLYVGLSTDTSSFRHVGTSARTFELVAWLVNRGADPHLLAASCYRSYPPARLALWREILDNFRSYDGSRWIFFDVTREALTKAGAVRDDAEGIIEWFETIRTVEGAFMLDRSQDDGILRVSLRSRGRVDVQAIAAGFGGGGHRFASGFRTRRPPEEVEVELVRACRQAA